MGSTLRNAVLVFLATLLLHSCSSSREHAVYQCKDLREQQSCEALSGQVCARIDTGVRCITTPCPSFEFRSYEDTCSACSDHKLTEVFTGSCEEFRVYLERAGDTP